MRIETRLAIALVLCLTVGVALAGYISYTIEFRQSRDEIEQTTARLLEAAIGIRDYTSAEIQPLIQAHKDSEGFHPQSVPAYAAQAVIKRVNGKFPEFTYREVALNPTNPNDRATDWEAGVIRQFREQPDTPEISGETGTGAGKRFFIARPIRVGSEACLSCHSTPEAAPKELLAKYGPGNGFGWKLQELIGLQVVEVAYAPAREHAIHSVLITVGSLVCLLLLATTVLWLVVRRYVLAPLEIITLHAETVSLMPPGGGPVPPSLEAEARLSRLLAAIERLSGSIALSSRLLGKSGRTGPGELP